MSQPAMPRTLPGLTLQELFNIIKGNQACWAQDGDVALTRRLLRFQSALMAKDDHKYTLRDVIKLHYDLKLLNGGEARWIINKANTKLCPVELTPSSTEADIKAWENPKPKKPRISELKPGTKYWAHGRKRIYTKLGNVSAMVIKPEFKGLCFMRDDFIIDAHLEDEEVDVV